MQEKKLVDSLFRPKFFFFEAILIVFYCLVLFFYQYPLVMEDFFSSQEKNYFDGDAPSKILVELEQSEKSFEKSKTISFNEQQGRGKISPSEKDQHLLGVTRLHSKKEAYAVSNRQWHLKFLNLRNLDKKYDQSANNPANNPYVGKMEKKQISFSLEGKLAIETKNSLSPQFWFTEDDLLSVSVQKEEKADFFFEFSQKLIERFALYLNNSYSINYHFLRRDSVSSLIKIDSGGRVYLVEIVSKAQYQPYLDYVAQKVFSNISLLKSSSVQDFFKTDNIYMVVSFFYTGPPLRKWWITFEEFKGEK